MYAIVYPAWGGINFPPPGFGLFGVPRGRNYLLAVGNLISFRPVCLRAWGSVIGPISGGYFGFESLAFSLSVFLAIPSL